MQFAIVHGLYCCGLHTRIAEKGIFRWITYWQISS
jgi:hypothetical protein